MDKKIIIGITVAVIVIVVIIIVVCMKKEKYQYNGTTTNNTAGTNTTWPTIVLHNNQSTTAPSPCLSTTLTSDSSGNLSTTSSVPNGAILMWAGGTIPTGWALCDGTQGTPDLRSRFIVGASATLSVSDKNLTPFLTGDSGGEEFHQLSVPEIPYHTHTVGALNGSNPLGGISNGSTVNATRGSYPTTYAGGDMPHNNMPPFYALAFIMKMV